MAGWRTTETTRRVNYRREIRSIVRYVGSRMGGLDVEFALDTFLGDNDQRLEVDLPEIKVRGSYRRAVVGEGVSALSGYSAGRARRMLRSME